MKRLGGYKLKGKVEAGGMAGLYKTRFGLMKADEREVALKAIKLNESQSPGSRSEAVIHFTQRLSATIDLRHPGVVGILDAGYDHPYVFIVEELVEAPSLAELLAAGPLPYVRIYAIVLGIAAVLARAHSDGLYHSGLNPTTVLITPAGPRLTEFGLRFALEGLKLEEDDGGLVDGGTQPTDLFLSPEHFGGKPDEDSDIFCFGSIIYALLGLGAPWKSDNQHELAKLIKTAPPPGIGSAGPLGALAMACLHKEPKSRPTAARLLEWLGG